MTNAPKNKKSRSPLVNRARELRREMTPQERTLWQLLRDRQLFGLKFRRQTPFGPFILDFFCYEHQLAVELDGHHHAEPGQQRYDQARTEWLQQQGLRVLRFTNREVETNLEGVLLEVARQCRIEP
jgi:very-short-patch-repair endonuclease